MQHSTTEQKDSTVKNNINIVERKQQVLDIFQGQFVGNQQFQKEKDHDKVIIDHSSDSENEDPKQKVPKIPVVKHEKADYLKLLSQKQQA